MWTPTARRQHSRAGLRYGSNLTDAEWAIFLIWYQARGARQHRRAALCMRTHVDWLRGQLERVHGPLARFEIAETPPQAAHENNAENLATDATATSAIIAVTVVETVRDGPGRSRGPLTGQHPAPLTSTR